MINRDLLREFRVALQRIAEDPEGLACECCHDDENCCEVVGEFCPTCIAATALAKETHDQPTLEERQAELQEAIFTADRKALEFVQARS